VLALYLLEPGYRVTSRARLFAAGAILAVVFALRIQLGPAVALIAIWTTLRGSRARLLAVGGGIVSALALVALLDAVTLGYPFASIWRNVLYNMYYNVSSTFGVEPWYTYLLIELAIWRLGLFVLLVLLRFGVRRTFLPLIVALVIIAVHSVIPHKEYRFIYPAVVLLAVEAGIGLAQLASWARELLSGFAQRLPWARATSAVAVPSAWCLLSLLTWTGPGIAAFRHRVHDYLVAASFVAHEPAVCGIGLYGLDGIDWEAYGGYSYFHQTAPMYWPKDSAELDATSGSFDILLYTTELHPAPAMPAGFIKRRCFGKVCLARRPGACDAAPMMPMPFPDPVAGLIPHR
jgi:GPI mannosyltransferase 3